MRRYLKHLLCGGATFLAFYAGYVRLGMTAPSECLAPSACAMTNCAAAGNLFGCCNAENTLRMGCVPSGQGNSCYVPVPSNYYICPGQNGQGNYCQFALYACSVGTPCPPS